MFVVCVFVCRSNGRLQHELRPSAAWTQHPCGNTGSCLHLVWRHLNTQTLMHSSSVKWESISGPAVKVHRQKYCGIIQIVCTECLDFTFVVLSDYFAWSFFHLQWREQTKLHSYRGPIRQWSYHNTILRLIVKTIGDPQVVPVSGFCLPPGVHLH